MLIFGDIHINHRYQNDILDEITHHIAKFPGEKNIIFLGDYVYHFAYDREALLGLYQLWISLFKQRKKLYILAGNHDRIGKSFVYQEAQKAFEIIDELMDQEGEIHFITQPLRTKIEDQEILFFPFSLEYESGTTSLFAEQEKYEYLLTEINTLREKKNKNFQLSADLNILLLSAVAEYEGQKDLLVIHHHYFDGIKFPGQQSRFSFKNIAISQQFLKLPKLKFLSGHLHQSFVSGSYLCAGSVRNTSSLETNQVKGFYRYAEQKREFFPLWINPNFSYLAQKNQILDKKILDQLLDTMRDELEKNLSQNTKFGEIVVHRNSTIPLKKSQITITTDQIDYENIDNYISSDLREDLKDMKLKKTKLQSLDMQQLATLYDRKSMNTFSDWKNLLKDFLKNTYPTEYEQYENFLIKHKIL